MHSQCFSAVYRKSSAFNFRHLATKSCWGMRSSVFSSHPLFVISLLERAANDKLERWSAKKLLLVRIVYFSAPRPVVRRQKTKKIKTRRKAMGKRPPPCPAGVYRVVIREKRKRYALIIWLLRRSRARPEKMYSAETSSGGSKPAPVNEPRRFFNGHGST